MPGYYYVNGADNFPSITNIVDDVIWADNITLGEAGQVTILGVKAQSLATNICKMLLFYNNAGTWTKWDCVEFTPPTSGAWNDVSLNTPYVNALNEIIRVGLIIDSDVDKSVYYVTGETRVYHSIAYADACGVTTPAWTNYNTASLGLRAYVDAAPAGGLALPILSSAGIHSAIFGGQILR